MCDIGPTISHNKLLGWQDLLLRVWIANIHRKATDTDVVLFSEILQVPENLVRSRLQQLLINDKPAQTGNEMGNYDAQAKIPGTEEITAAPQDGIYEPQVLPQGSIRSEGTNQQGSFDFLGVPATSMLPQITLDGAPETHDPQLSNEIPERRILRATTSSDAMAFDFSSPLNQDRESLVQYPTIVQSSRSRNASEDALHIKILPQLGAPNAQDRNFQFMSWQNMALVDSFPSQEPPRVTMTPSLHAAILRFIHARQAKGCQAIRSHEKQAGIHECTLECNRRFKTACDLFRHEATIYPQEFWFCLRCSSLENASEKCLFTREDKIRQHNKAVHDYLGPVASSKVPNAPQVFPKRCTLCTHQRHRTWKDRCKHIIWHYKRGDTFVKSLRSQGEDVDPAASDPGDDGDDDDNDNFSRNNNNDEDQSGHGRGSNSIDKSSPPGDGPGEDGSSGREAQGGSTDFSSSIDWSSPFFWDLKTNIAIATICKDLAIEKDISSSQDISIIRKERVNQKGGTASVFKVEVSTIGIEAPKHPVLVVKQYKSHHRRLFEQELEAFSRLHRRQPDHPSIVRCFGSFIQADSAGAPTYSLLMENAGYDLREFFADRPRPTRPGDITRLWGSVLSITDGLRFLHQQDDYSGFHADLKPDNILYFEETNTFKLADFGLSKFVKKQDHVATTAIMNGGTVTYGMLTPTL